MIPSTSISAKDIMRGMRSGYSQSKAKLRTDTVGYLATLTAATKEIITEEEELRTHILDSIEVLTLDAAMTASVATDEQIGQVTQAATIIPYWENHRKNFDPIFKSGNKARIAGYLLAAAANYSQDIKAKFEQGMADWRYQNSAQDLKAKLVDKDADEIMNKAKSVSAALEVMQGDAVKYIENTKQTLEQEIKLEAGYGLWDERNLKYTEMAERQWGKAIDGFWMAGLLLTIYMILNLVYMFQYPTKPLHFSTIGSVFLLTTVVLYAIRLQQKQYFASRQIAEDAAERTAMLKTYLALVKDGKVSDEVVGVILEALFRETATGLVADDRGQNTELLKLFAKLKG